MEEVGDIWLWMVEIWGGVEVERQRSRAPAMTYPPVFSPPLVKRKNYYRPLRKEKMPYIKALRKARDLESNGNFFPHRVFLS